MVTVIGLWEPDWFDTERSERRLYGQTIRAFNVDNWIMIPSNGKVFTRPIQYDSIEEAFNTIEGKRTFFVSPRTMEGIPLEKYKHPEKAVYVIGNASDSLVKYIREDDDVVSVYSPTQAALFGSSFISIVLWDRMIKNEYRQQNTT